MGELAFYRCLLSGRFLVLFASAWERSSADHPPAAPTQDIPDVPPIYQPESPPLSLNLIMTSPNPLSRDASSSESYPISLSIFHEESNAKFILKCANQELLSERFGLKRLLRVVVPKVKSGANVSAAMLSYRDEDGDEIAVRTDSDLKEAIRIANVRQILLTITFDAGAQPICNLDSSVGESGGCSVDSASEMQFECHNVAPDVAPEIPSCIVEQPISAVSIAQPVSADIFQGPDESQRISRIELQLQQCGNTHPCSILC
jgi:hypothetical protein